MEDYTILEGGIMEFDAYFGEKIGKGRSKSRASWFISTRMDDWVIFPNINDWVYSIESRGFLL